MPEQLSPDLRVYDGSAANIAAGEPISTAPDQPFSAWEGDVPTAAADPQPRPQQPQQTADRYQAILRGGAEAIGCQSAAFYVLNDTPSQLQLQAAWEFDPGQAGGTARPLSGCPADVEALSGHVVAMEHEGAGAHWKAPKDAPSALCVPVSSPTAPLGTLWLFCDRQRPFDDSQTNIAEIVAGRLASDLQRDRLLKDVHVHGDLRRQVATVGRWWKSQLPTITPMIDGWEMAAWVQTSGLVGGDFYDWFLRPDNSLCLAVGDALACDLDAALAAAALRAAVRAHGQYATAPHVLLERVNRTLWTSSAGDQFASLFFAALNTATGELEFSTAGDPSAVVLGAGVDEVFSKCESPLGAEPDPLYKSQSIQLQPSQVLAIVTDGIRDALNRRGRLWGDAGLRQVILDHKERAAAEIAEAVRRELALHTADAETDDQTLLIVKRSG